MKIPLPHLFPPGYRAWATRHPWPGRLVRIGLGVSLAAMGIAGATSESDVGLRADGTKANS